MPVVVGRARGRGATLYVALVVSAGYALGAAATTPFTWAANVMTALPIAVVTVLAFVLWPARPEPADLFAAEERPPRPYLWWIVLLAVVVGWELAEYLVRGSRSAHPTLSSMADAFDGHYLLKAVAFFAWLWLGAAIVRAGTAATASSRAVGTHPS